MQPIFDERDAEILAERVIDRDKREGPRLGDFVILLNGDIRRLAVKWFDDDFQPTKYDGSGGGFYLGSGGYMSFSGTLDDGINKERLHDTGRISAGDVWFFHHGHVQAHNAVYGQIPCRIYEERIPQTPNGETI